MTAPAAKTVAGPVTRAVALALIPLLLALASCAPGNTRYWENGNKRERGEIINQRREGPWTRWYQFGHKMEAGSYRLNKKVGKWIRWHQNGQVQWMSHYADGKRHGAYVAYRRDGSKSEQGKFSSGQRHGVWIKYYPGEKGRDRIVYQKGIEASRTHLPSVGASPP